MLKCFETQRAGKTNRDHCVAVKKNVSIVVIQFWLTHSFVNVWLSHFHRQNSGYLQGGLLYNMIWHGKFVFIFVKDLNSTVAKRGSVFIGLMTPNGAIWFRYQRAVLMR